MWRFSRFLIVGLLVLVSLGGTAAVRQEAKEKDRQVLDQQAVVAGNTSFAFDLYAKLKDDPKLKKKGGNLFFSPYSISAALAMTYAGARGDTEKQMAQVLHFTLPPDRLHPALAGLKKNWMLVRNMAINSAWQTPCGGKKGTASVRNFLI